MQRSLLVKVVLTLVFTVLGFLVMGYHPGYEDDGIYLTAVKADLQPALYPHGSDFFRLQLQATVFDRCMAEFSEFTRIPVAWTELLWQFLSILGIVIGAYGIARHVFPQPRARWAGVAMVVAMFTLPVAGTALNIVDQHLHPRNLATALILIAAWRILSDKGWQAIPLLMFSFVIHPIMAAMGISFCVFLSLTSMGWVHVWLRSRRAQIAAAAPLSWIFEPPSPTWREALNSRTYYFLYKWTWYEWLGAIGPLVLFWLLWRFAKSRNDTLLARFALAVLAYGICQQAVAMVMLTPASLVRLTPLQPMRYLQLVYLFMALAAGALIGKYLLKGSVLRWAIYLVVINGSMFWSQRALFASTPHMEFPGSQPANPWLQAFAWVRQNTPVDAYFALDPNYLAAPGEDFHSFRALAERSQLADAIKDTAVVTQVPQLGPEWRREKYAQLGWDRFQLSDFQRLKAQFGVNWVLVRNTHTSGLDCRWHNDLLSVCMIPN